MTSRINGVGLEVERDEPERLSSDDDRATRREEEFLADALARRAREAAIPGRPGVCANCEATIAATARFCDVDCREDHERRVRAARLTGRRS